jgi:aryl-alcohol dehydrogenase-like predicted oxidoreductase
MHLILGTAGLSQGYGVLGNQKECPDFGDWIDALRNLDRFGFGAIDTAPVYGHAELTIGEANPSVLVHTKLNPGIEPTQSLRHSLGRLKRAKVDVLYFHERYLGDESQALAIKKLNEFRGLSFEELGVSIYDEQEFESALDSPDIDVIQVPFSVLDRRFDEQKVALAHSAGKAVTARSVFLQGILIGGLGRIPRTLGHLRPSIKDFIEICEGWRTSTLDAAIAFVKSRRDFHGIIVGARAPHELPELAQGFEAPVEGGLLEDLAGLVPLGWPATDPRTWRAQ